MSSWRVFDGGVPLIEWTHHPRTSRLRHLIADERYDYRLALFRDDRNTDWNGAA